MFQRFIISALPRTQADLKYHENRLEKARGTISLSILQRWVVSQISKCENLSAKLQAVHF